MAKFAAKAKEYGRRMYKSADRPNLVFGLVSIAVLIAAGLYFKIHIY